MSNVNSLRAVIHRLNNTPVKDLPHIAHFLASTVSNCANTLKFTLAQSTGKNNDLTLQINRFKARISSLLQDRSAEGRFTAVILVKATVEAGGREILSSCEPWLRGLLTVLSRPDPVSSKRLCLLTITRIFSLTEQYPTLIREITTPMLPAFLTVCINLGALHPPGGTRLLLLDQVHILEQCFNACFTSYPITPARFGLVRPSFILYWSSSLMADPGQVISPILLSLCSWLFTFARPRRQPVMCGFILAKQWLHPFMESRIRFFELL